jgi:Uma2 family endonuclease
MDQTTGIITAEELLAVPDDGWRYELVDGELLKMTPSGFQHGVVVVSLTRRLAQHVEDGALGAVCGAETGFVLTRSPDTVRAPDVAFVSRVRIAESGVPAGFWEGPPDLAVEVMSPGDSAGEVDGKARSWLSAGTRAVWVVNPHRRTVAIWRHDGSTIVLSEDQMLDGGDVVPGFTCRVTEIFPGAGR